MNKPHRVLFTIYQVLFTANAINLFGCQHWCIANQAPAPAISTATSTVTGGLQPDIEEMLLRAPKLYSETALAAVQLAVGCQSPLVVVKGEIIPLIADHCLPPSNSLLETMEAKVAEYFFDEDVGGGYLFLTSTVSIGLPLKEMKRDKNLDLAYARGLFPKGLPSGRQPLRLASSSPKRGELVMVLRRHFFFWGEEAKGLRSSYTAEVFTPNFGVSYGAGDPNQPTEYLFAAFKGDSGSPIINAWGEVVGIVWRQYPDKRKLIKTYATSPEKIWEFLTATWDD